MYSDSKSIISRFKSYSGTALILGLVVAIAAPGFLWTDWLNSQMFRVGTYLLPSPPAVKNIRLVQIPDEAYNQPDEIKRLRFMLKKLNRYKAKGVAVLMDPLPSLDYQSIEEDKKTKTSKTQKEDENKWEFTRGELNKLAWSLEHYNVKAGIISQHNQTGYYSFPNKADIELDENIYLTKLKQYLKPNYNVVNKKIGGMSYAYERYPLSLQEFKNAKPMIWFDETGNKFVPDLVLKLYAQLQNDDDIDLLDKEGVQLASEVIKTNNKLEVYEYYSKLTGHDAGLKTYSLEQALNFSSKNINNKIFIIGDDVKQLKAAGNSLANLMASATYHSPYQTNWIINIGLCLTLIFLIVFLPSLRKSTGILLTVILVLVGIIVQYSLLITQGIWVSLLAIYIYLVFGHVIIHLKQITDSRLDHVKLVSHDALWQLGQYLYDQGNHDKALTSLLKCKPTDDVMTLLYNIGLSFERRRMYDKAMKLYSDIEVRRSNYKDVKKRLSSLTNVATQHSEMLSPTQVKTLVMPDMDIELPTLGRYELERELGRGAMGIVYLGKDPAINRQVAIKTLDYSQFSEKEIKSIKSRFFREAEAAGRLNHPNIVTVYDVGDEEDFAFIAMDFVPGVSLGEHTSKDALLPVDEVYRIIADVAETLDYAHGQNIVHRDIKPSNIMYDGKTGNIKITDFGIARITDSVRTRTGSFMGSPSYMAPEQMTGANVDGAADIYALGVSFYQLLTGTLPFDADSIGNLAYKITNEKHKPIRDIRPDLPQSATRIVNKALQKKADNRYASGIEMAKALRRGMPSAEE